MRTVAFITFLAAVLWVVITCPIELSKDGSSYPSISVKELRANSQFFDEPIVLSGTVQHSFSSRFTGGAYQLADGDDTIVIVTRNITPPTDSAVQVLCVARALIRIQNQQFLYASEIKRQEMPKRKQPVPM